MVKNLKTLLTMPTAQLGKASRFGIFQIKLWTYCARLLKHNRATQVAAALSYRTIFGVVPLAIVMLWVFNQFPAYSGMGQRVKNFVYDQVNLSLIRYGTTEGEETIDPTNFFDNITSEFFRGVNAGSITFISLVIVIWAAVTLLSTIETAFNSIWHVAKGRGFLHRIINYWALLTLGPILLGVGIYITTEYAFMNRFKQTFFTGIAPVIFSYVLSTTAFFLLYFMLPNTKVKAKPTLWGAAVAALVWSFAKWGFSAYVLQLIPYQKVYGMLGLIPLTVLWIYISWLIVLFGLQLTFTTQHLKTLDAAEMAKVEKTEEHFIANDWSVMNIVSEIADAFEKNNAPVTPEVICSKLNLPAEFGERLFEHLIVRGILVKSSEPIVGFMPAKDPRHTNLSEIAEAVAFAGFAQPTAKHAPVLNQIQTAQKEALGRYSLEQLLSNKKIDQSVEASTEAES